METTLPVAEFWPPYRTKLKNLLEAFVHVKNELMELLYHKKKTLTLNNKKTGPSLSSTKMADYCYYFEQEMV